MKFCEGARNLHVYLGMIWIRTESRNLPHLIATCEIA